MTDDETIERFMSLAYDLSGSNRKADAEGAFLEVTELAPDWSVPWYELGLLCKYQRRWTESLDYNRRAADLDPTDQASWWNMGIAATAVGEWTEARRAWAACDIQLPAGDGPPEMDLGPVPVRLDPDSAGEVVWARRIDPARAIIENVPLPTSPYRWHDLVLHDGAPEGYRRLDGRDVPVFNVLDRLRVSDAATFVVELGSSDSASVARLRQIAEEFGGTAEDWGTATHILCRECSYGVPHEHDQHEHVPAHQHCGIAAASHSQAQQVIDRWLDETPNADLVRWYPVDMDGEQGDEDS